MANIAIFRINYKSDFILTLNSDAGWMTPFCIKFWTGAPSQAYFVGYDGTTYTHCAPVDGEPTKLLVQFDDHHLPIGDLKFQIGYHFTVADFPNDVEDEVLNQASVIIEQDGEPAQVMLDFNGETAPEIEFSLPAYANEAQRIANEQQRIAAETQRIANEETRIANEQTRINQEQTRQQNEQQRINQEQARVNEYASLKADAVAATGAANDAAALANQKAQLAADKAALAQSAAQLANDKAQLAADKAALAQAASQLCDEKAALAQQKATYAQQQGDYSKAQGDYAKEQGDYSKEQGDYSKEQGDYSKEQGDYAKDKGDICAEDHQTAVADHQTAVADHQTAVADHQTAVADHQTAQSDHGIAADDHTQAGNDHTRAESDHTRAESDHAAVEVYVDSLGVFDLSKHNAVGGVLATYADLSAALTALNALDSKYKYGGMSFKFVQSSDNKYVQARCMAQSFTTDVTQWQGVDSEITAGSKNLVESGGVAEKGIAGFPLVAIAATIGQAHITATGQFYFNTTRKKVVYIKNYIDAAHADTVDIDPIKDVLYIIDKEFYIYDEDTQTMSKWASDTLESDNMVGNSAAVKNYVNNYVAESAQSLIVSVPIISVVPPSGETITKFNPFAISLLKDNRYKVIVTNNGNVECQVKLAKTTGGSANVVQNIGSVNAGETKEFIFKCTSEEAKYIWFRYQSAVDTAMSYGFDASVQIVCSSDFKTGQALKDISVTSNIVPDGNNDVPISSAVSTCLHNIETDICCDKGDFDYILIKDASSYTREEDANGTRLSMVMKITKPCILELSSSYPYICNTYNNVPSAIAAESSGFVETITGNTYIEGPIKALIHNVGYLSVRIKKSDNSAITSEDKANIIKDLVFKLYSEDGIYSEIPKIDYKEAELTASIININSNLRERCKNITAQGNNVVFVGKNILDSSTLKQGKILNDSGQEISDSSSYYTQKIPCHGMTICSNVGMQRIYKYDENNNFLGREVSWNNRFEYEVPNNVFFVQIQVQTVYNTMCVIYKNNIDNTDYEKFSSGNIPPTFGTVNAYDDGINDITVAFSVACKAVIPAVKEYDFWEPATVTDDYKCTHLGQYTQSIPELTDTLKYRGFLSTYYDIYIGEYEDGYKVTKEELGLDSGAAVEHAANPIFSYIFAPKYYNKTVLLSAGMNTCEASTYFGLAYFIKALMEHTEAGMLALYNSTRFVVMPVMCPTGISHNPLLYRSANDVRINKNFSYNDSWQFNYERGGQYPGDYPDSEVETKILKQWMNRYGGVTFYMDCHSDTGGSDTQANSLAACICSDTATINKLQYRKDEVEEFYRDKGYIPVGTTPTQVFWGGGDDYPKTPYSWSILRTPALMYEQYIRSTMYGSDGHTNNDIFGIKNYVAMIRWYVLIMCKSDIEFVFD